MNRQTERQYGKGALDIVEEAASVLRGLPVTALAAYYTGAMPFILAFLFFWADMSRGAFGHDHLPGAAAALTLLFVWMKCWQSVFASRVKSDISGEPPSAWSSGRALRLIIVQTAIQPLGLIALPLSLLLTFPFGWVYAFYQNATVAGSGEDGDMNAICRRSWQQAGMFPYQNHVIIFILSAFCLFVFFNFAALVYLFPLLLKTLFGIETIFARAGWHIFNTTFFAVTGCLTYLAVDPLIKTVYVLRCFYGESLKTGEDLKVMIRRFRHAGSRATIIIFLACMAAASPAGAAGAEQSNGQPDPARVAAGMTQEKALDEAIRAVISSPEYSWRLPREEEAEHDDSTIAAWIAGAAETLKRWLDPVGKWIRKALIWIYEHLEHMLKNMQFKPKNRAGGAGWMGTVNLLFYVLLAVALSALALALLRLWKKRRKPAALAGQPATTLPDISRDEVTADELPLNTWLDLARKLMQEGDLRLALRALYLASLSHLAGRELIHIARYKSNCDYEQELRRKAGAMPELLAAFSENRRIFENIWYGMHEVNAGLLEAFTGNQKRIMADEQ